VLLLRGRRTPKSLALFFFTRGDCNPGGWNSQEWRGGEMEERLEDV
jgi:hypothetical protein